MSKQADIGACMPENALWAESAGYIADRFDEESSGKHR